MGRERERERERGRPGKSRVERERESERERTILGERDKYTGREIQIIHFELSPLDGDCFKRAIEVEVWKVS